MKFTKPGVFSAALFLLLFGIAVLLAILASEETGRPWAHAAVIVILIGAAWEVPIQIRRVRSSDENSG